MKTALNSKAQTSIEMFVFVGMAYLILIIFIGVLAQRTITAQQNSEQLYLNNIASQLHEEVRIASSVSSGYSRSFELPLYAGTKDYQITILNSNVIRAFTENFEATRTTYNITGQPDKGANTIRKENGTISIS